MLKFERFSSVLVWASFGMLHLCTLAEGTLQGDHYRAIFKGAWVCVCMGECVWGVLIYMGCFLLLIKTGNPLKSPGLCPSSSISEHQESSGHPEKRGNPLRKGLIAH